MAETYTLEQLQKMGAKPVPDAEEAERLTLDQVRAKGGAEVPQVGGGETFLLHSTQALPAGGLVTDLLSTAVVEAGKRGMLPGALSRLGINNVEGERATLTPEARAELEAMGETVEEPKGVLDSYRDLRDTRRIRTAAGGEQNPTAARLGTATGIGLSIAAPLPKTNFGGVKNAEGVLQFSRAARLGNAAATGAAYGALSGATDGEADLTRGEVGGALADTAGGAVTGGALGLGAAGAVELARPLAGALRRFAVGQAKKTVQGGSDIAAATRKPMSEEAAAEVLDSGAIRPMSTTQATAARIEQLAAERGEVYGKILDDLERAGVQGPNAKALADQIYARYLEEYPNYVSSKTIPDIYKTVAKNIEDAANPGPRAPASKLSKAKAAEAPPVVEGPPRPNLGLRQTEAIKRDLQDVAKYERLQANPSNEAYRELASTVREANEEAIRAAGAAAPEGSELRKLAESFEPVKAQLARTLEARHFARPGASKAEQRSAVGLKDYLLGAASGSPAGALGTALVSSVARNRMPSTLAYGANSLSEGLRTGSASSGLSAALGGAAELAGDEARSRADRATIDNETDALTAAVIRALRKKPKQDGDTDKKKGKR